MIELYQIYLPEAMGIECDWDANADWRNGATIPTTLGDAIMAQVTYRGVKYDTNNRPNKDAKAEKATLVYRGIAVKS